MRASTVVILAFFIMVFIAVTALWFVNRPHNQRVAEIRSQLTAFQGDGARYDSLMVAGLPDPARRYLETALSGSERLPRRVGLVMRGEIRTGPGGDWMPFHGRQILVRGTGFLWEAEMDLGALMWLKGADYYFNGEGRVWFSLNSLLPVVTASGRVVDRSAAGRLMIEQVLIPTSFLPLYGAQWTEIDSHNAEVLIEQDGVQGRITLQVDDEGNPVQAVMPRVQADDYGNEITRTFGVRIEAWDTFDGISVPVRMAAGWDFGTDDYFEFFIAEFTEVQFY